jgi:hypothetical protein
VAPGDALVVCSDAPVDAGVLLLLALHRAQEEEAAVGEEDAVRRGVRGGRAHGLTVTEPLDLGVGVAARLATQGHGLVSGHSHGDGVLCDARVLGRDLGGRGRLLRVGGGGRDRGCGSWKRECKC